MLEKYVNRKEWRAKASAKVYSGRKPSGFTHKPKHLKNHLEYERKNTWKCLRRLLPFVSVPRSTNREWEKEGEASSKRKRNSKACSTGVRWTWLGTNENFIMSRWWFTYLKRYHAYLIFRTILNGFSSATVNFVLHCRTKCSSGAFCIY